MLIAVGKGEIRTVHIPRWLTVIAWMIVTGAMVAGVYELSGRAYAKETTLSSIVDALRRSPTATSVLAAIAPATVDFLFFLPWGALTFLAVDSRSRKATYIVTLVLGVAFALGLWVWQQTLPTRITGGIDALWNVAGAAAGAMLAHARKRVRMRFE